MKLGLVGMITVAALVAQVFATDYYMFSVFLIGIKVGKLKLVKNPNRKEKKKVPKVKKHKEGEVRFRVILFKSLKAPKSKKPTNKDIEWKIHDLTDFDLTFDELKRDFMKKFFNDFLFKCKFHTDGLEAKDNYYKEIKDSSFSIKAYETEFETKSTHIGSLISDFDFSKDSSYSVAFDEELHFHFFTNGKTLEKSLKNFKIKRIELEAEKCLSAKTKFTYKMESKEHKNRDNEIAKGSIFTVEAYEKRESEAWKGAKYKVFSTLTKGGKSFRDYSPFKLKTKDKIANVILVVNYIPIRRLYDNTNSRLSLSHDFKFNIEPQDMDSNTSSFPEPYSSGNAGWDELKQGFNTFADPSFSNADLTTQWGSYENPFSITLFFACSSKFI